MVLHAKPLLQEGYFVLCMVYMCNAASASCKQVYSAHAAHTKNKPPRKYQVHMKHHPNNSLNNIMVFSSVANYNTCLRLITLF